MAKSVLTHADGTAIQLCNEALSIDSYVCFDSPVFLDHHKSTTALRLTLRDHSSMHLIERVGDASEVCCSLEVEIGEGACLYYTRLFLGPASADLTLRAVVQRGGTLLCKTAVAQPAFKANSSIILQGEGASATFKGFNLLCCGHTSHQILTIDHQAPHTSSSQLVKGLAADRSSGLVESRVRICKEAKGSLSRQYSHFLTLGATAKTAHKPTFEILTDDVIASHGATTGMLDEEALFYLQARGLGIAEARRQLIEGFCAEVLQELPSDMTPVLCQRIDETIGAALS